LGCISTISLPVSLLKTNVKMGGITNVKMGGIVTSPVVLRPWVQVRQGYPQLPGLPNAKRTVRRESQLNKSTSAAEL